jgi:hypothetical protein
MMVLYYQCLVVKVERGLVGGGMVDEAYGNVATTGSSPDRPGWLHI